MKKFITLFVISFITFAATAAQPTKLSISSLNNYSLTIVIDGRSYNYNQNKNDAVFELGNLSPGQHALKIYRQQNRGRRTISSGSGNNGQLLYSSNVFLRPQYHTDIVINRFGKVFTDEMQLGYNDEGNNDYPNYNYAMQAVNFDALRQAVSRESFDNTRSNIIRQAAATNYFSATQVKSLLQVFSFENTRLDLAKFLYSRTVDKGNYFVVNDVFSFSNSKDDLYRYIIQNP